MATRSLLSLHESCHLVVGEAIGLHATHVSLSPPAVDFEPFDTIEKVQKSIISGLAGFLSTSEQSAADMKDIKRSIEYLESCGYIYDNNSYVEAAHQLIKNNSFAIKIFTNVLSDRGELSENEIRKILKVLK